KYYKELTDADVSNEYIDTISAEFKEIREEAEMTAEGLMGEIKEASYQGMDEVLQIQKEFDVESTHFVKPGVGETTRVLLRRVPWKILMKDPKSPFVRHILMLAEERNVEVIHYPNMSYTCCGLIKKAGN